MNDTQKSVIKATEGIERLKVDTEKMNRTVITFEKCVTEKIKDISTMNVTILGKNVEGNTKAIKESNKKISQVHMYIRYNKYKDDLELSFEEMVQLVGEVNFLEKNSTTVQKLLQQAKEFRRYEGDWNISYRDVIRLTDGYELKTHAQLSTIRKLVMLNKEFTIINNQRGWGIWFKGKYSSFKNSGHIRSVTSLSLLFFITHCT